MAWGREISRAAVAALCFATLVAPDSAAAAGPPQIGASWVTEVTATGANLRVTINPNGLETGYRFEYITEAAYQANLQAAREGFFGAAEVPPASKPEAGAGSSPIFVAKVQHVSGLTPATAYRYRPVARNSAATTIGPEHVLTTEESSLVFRLPDGRGWEMVSPVDKGGGAIAAPEALFGGGAFQAAPTAHAVTYGSATAFGNAVSSPPASQYVSQLAGSGWGTENVSAPVESGAYGDEPDGAPYRVFSTDLSRALLFGGLACRGDLPGCPAPNPPLPGSGAPAGYMAYYLRDGASGAFTSLLGAADVAHSAVSPEGLEVALAGASPDLSHVVLSSCAKLTTNATEVLSGPNTCEPAEQNLYEWSAAGLALVNVLPGESSGTPGAVIAAPIGAVSDTGTRVYFAQLEDGALYLREAGGPTMLLPGTAGGGASFQTASASGSVAFYTVGATLYRYDAGTEAATPIATGVTGVVGASTDGERVYFQDTGGLELWHAGTTTTIAPGASATMPSDYPPATATARLTADGTRLAFLSRAELTGYDNTDSNTGQPDAELYVYGPPLGGGPAVLACASCNPTGERPQGPASIPGALANGSTRLYRPRSLSKDGSRLFFDTRDSLVVQDTNAAPDVYEWEAKGPGCGRSPGCVGLLSSGRSPAGARFVDASADGADVYLITEESLVGTDPGSIDLYDAREGGGFPEPAKPIACVGDACQILPREPDDPTPGTLAPNPGNPARHFVKEKSRRARHHRRQHRHRHGRGHRRARRIEEGRR